MKLEELQSGETGTIVNADPRLQEMGLRVGLMITRIRGGVYNVAGTQFTLRGTDIEIS